MSKDNTKEKPLNWYRKKILYTVEEQEDYYRSLGYNFKNNGEFSTISTDFTGSKEVRIRNLYIRKNKFYKEPMIHSVFPEEDIDMIINRS